ncbi:MAG: hypothetical protein M1823_001042 [Watsoniomyces obsoletus]|nr:MAG: hypothetical protein M1823_001042 [Watsoniomyces obsoletus]
MVLRPISGPSLPPGYGGPNHDGNAQHQELPPLREVLSYSDDGRPGSSGVRSPGPSSSYAAAGYGYTNGGALASSDASRRRPEAHGVHSPSSYAGSASGNPPLPPIIPPSEHYYETYHDGQTSPYGAYSSTHGSRDGYHDPYNQMGYTSPNGSSGSVPPRRRRGNLPRPVTDLLKNWFRAHQSHPYPSEEEKQILMGQTGLTITQLSNWFINARRRELPEMDRQARANAMTQNGGSIESDES